MAIDFPADLLALEHAAWTEIQAGTLTVDTAAAVQAAVTQYAADHGHQRDEVEMGLKKAVRHPETKA
ncbi:MAG TPA: hypothetical protein VI172_04140 [Candidatus Dormibacteraeota bacterium]